MIDKECYMSHNCTHIMCGDNCIKKGKLDCFYNKSNFSLKQRYPFAFYVDNDVEHDDTYVFSELTKIKNDIVDFVEKGNDIFLYSTTCGNGKTSWALTLCQEYLNKVWLKKGLDECPIMYINVPFLLLELKRHISQQSDYIDNLNENIYKADLVIWDDIATKTGTSYEMENLYAMINSRIDWGKSNIYTSNVESELDLKEKLGDRLFSRIYQGSKKFLFKGLSKRNLKVE